MRLSNIFFARPVRVASRLLAENISKSDFFDLYSLATAHSEKHLSQGDPEQAREVQRRLAFEAQYVFRDQMDQLFCIIANRMMEADPDDNATEGANTQPLFWQYD